MITFKDYYTINEGRFKHSPKVVHVMDLPMFSIFLEKQDSKELSETLHYVSDQVIDAFQLSKKRIDKMGFPSMHVNVLFKDTSEVSVSNSGETGKVGGYATGNPKADKHYKKVKSIAINKDYLGLLETDFTGRIIIELIKVIVHEWAHIWMFNNGKAFRDAIIQYREAMVYSNIDKIPYPYYDKEPKEIFTKFRKYLMSLYYHIKNNPPQNLEGMISTSLKRYVSKLGMKSVMIDPWQIRKITDELMSVFESDLSYEEVENFIEKMNMDKFFGNTIKDTIQPQLIKRKEVRDKLAKMAKFTRAYGLLDEDETWATAVEEFFTLDPYHRKRILELMQVKGQRELPNRRMQKHLNMVNNLDY
jgi:hypothetical protein